MLPMLLELGCKPAGITTNLLLQRNHEKTFFMFLGWFSPMDWRLELIHGALVITSLKVVV
jgi:hypothetical protein